jgi:penicillin-binding protein 1A
VPSSFRVIATFFRNRASVFKQRLRRNPDDPARRWIRRHWPWLSLLTLACVGVFAFDAWLTTCGFYGCPSPAEIRAFHPSEGGNVYDRNSKLLGHLENIRRVNVSVTAVPKHVRAAFVATEDRRFYEHNGLDWHGVLRAVARNFSAGGIRQGFSTITMQVAHNSFLADRYHGRSLRRKLVELRISRLLERELTKDQILEHYLNVIYLGNGVNGIEAASLDLFGKSVNKLTLPEGALLAALPKAPSAYTPRRYPQRAEQRRNLVLSLMADQGFINAAQATAAARTPLKIAENEWRPSITAEPSALDAVRALVDSVLPDVLKEGDVNVYTTVDGNLQRAADRVVIRHIDDITRETRAIDRRLTESAQGALVALDPNSGDVRALVPGKRTQRGGFNRAFSARRQPGSAFKPFVYAAALEAGRSLNQRLIDEPLEMRLDKKQVWSPRNFDRAFEGPISMRDALVRSKNIPTIRLAADVGMGTVARFAERVGIAPPISEEPSMPLGTVELSLEELTAAYGAFAGLGQEVMPRFILRVERANGELVWSAPPPERHLVLEPGVAYLINDVLSDALARGTGAAVRQGGFRAPAAGNRRAARACRRCRRRGRKARPRGG